MKKITIGILSLQGAFAEHRSMLETLGTGCFEIRKREDLERSMDGIILPGGESTVQGKLLRELGMFDRLRKLIADGLPTYGTCAGLLLLAKKIDEDEPVHLALMDITAKRNAYGRQLGSFYTEADFKGIGKVKMPFIRAPYIMSAGDRVEILAVVNGKSVAAVQDNMLVTSFHPEVTDDNKVHKYFLSMIEK